MYTALVVIDQNSTKLQSLEFETARYKARYTVDQTHLLVKKSDQEERKKKSIKWASQTGQRTLEPEHR
jgi:hypothetical protein